MYALNHYHQIIDILIMEDYLQFKELCEISRQIKPEVIQSLILLGHYYMKDKLLLFSR